MPITGVNPWFLSTWIEEKIMETSEQKQQGKWKNEEMYARRAPKPLEESPISSGAVFSCNVPVYQAWKKKIKSMT